MSPDGVEIPLDRTKLDALTINVGQLTASVRALGLSVGTVSKDGALFTPADKLHRRARIARWRKLYPVRELVHALTGELRAAANRLDAEWERAEEELCATSDGKRARRGRK